MAERERCKAEVWRPPQWRPSQCSRHATLDGYCATHHPDAIAKRYERSRVQAERARETARQIANAPIVSAVAARDAEWRAAVKALPTVPVQLTVITDRGVHSANVQAVTIPALDALLAAMEAT